MVTVTRHAIQRYQQRVRAVSDDEAITALTTPAIVIAANFGAKYVRLGTGHRVVIQNRAIVTVQPVEHYKRMIHREGLGRFGKSAHWLRKDEP